MSSIIASANSRFSLGVFALQRPQPLRLADLKPAGLGINSQSGDWQKFKGQWEWFWPTVLLAAKTYANDPVKRALTVSFCTFEG
jgi:hypothetical protein